MSRHCRQPDQWITSPDMMSCWSRGWRDSRLLTLTETSSPTTTWSTTLPDLVPSSSSDLSTRGDDDMDDEVDGNADIITDPKSRMRFRRGPLIGQGGFAKVFKVVDVATNQCLADKVIFREVFSRRNISKEKIQREIALHRQMNHPNVVHFWHHFVDDKLNVHILLEFCPMKSLLHVMKTRKVLTEPEVRFFMVQICEGVRYIHHCGILHRDLKLGNMFLTAHMTLKIGDFGLATRFNTLDNCGGNAQTSSSLCGTPNYIAPEVLKKQGHGAEADIWAMGCMMYAMLVGTPPFETKSLSKTYQKIAMNEYVIPDRISPLSKCFIRKLLHPDPQQRGHLRAPGHSDDLVSHAFFSKGFCPNSLPQSASTKAPKMPLESIRESNLRARFSSGSIKQKLCQMFHVPQANSSKSRPEDSPVFKMLDAIEAWCVSRATSRIKTKELLFPLSFIPVFVTKWIDWSNKYGFGYQLSDNSVGVLLNDSSLICRTKGGGYHEFVDAKGQLMCFNTSSDGPPEQLSSHLKLLDYFARYMEEHLAEGVTGSLCKNQMVISTYQSSVLTHVTCWLRTSSAVIMALNNSSIQINFVQDHTKMLFWGNPDELAFMFVTYMSTDSAPLTYSLYNIAQMEHDFHFNLDLKISLALDAIRELTDRLEAPSSALTTTKQSQIM